MPRNPEAIKRARQKYDKENPIVAVRLPKEVVECLKTIPGNMSNHIREAVEEWLHRKEKS